MLEITELEGHETNMLLEMNVCLENKKRCIEAEFEPFLSHGPISEITRILIIPDLSCYCFVCSFIMLLHLNWVEEL
jgi:hypothetical protein